MPNEPLNYELRSEEVQEIISSVPRWILRWGIMLIFFIFGGIILLSALIEYPDIIKTGLKINSLNAPKHIYTKQNGKITTLLVKDGQRVVKDQPLAFMESTGSHEDIIFLCKELKKIQSDASQGLSVANLPENLKLGELQISYLNFYQQFLQYQATRKNGYYLNKLAFLEKDLKSIKNLRNQIIKQKEIRSQEFANQQQEYDAYNKLYKNKVISRSEYKQQENKFLASKYPLQDTETSLLSNLSSFTEKEKELLDLKHTVTEEKAKFTQSLNQCVSEIERWIGQFVLCAPISGKVGFAGIVQQNQNFMANQEIFYVNPGNTNFFGEMQIPQYNMGRIHIGDRTLVKLKSYPYEQYGLIRGKLTYISDVAYQDSLFVAKVIFEHFENKDPKMKILLKNGMLADAEIITEESTLLSRFSRNIFKIFNER